MSALKELYRIVEGSNIYTFTSADTEEVYLGETYKPVAVGRDGIQNKMELAKANLTLTFDKNNQMARNWMVSILDNRVNFTLFCKEDNDVNVIWKGKLSTTKPDKTQIILIFESIVASQKRNGPKLRCSRSCPHVLYGKACGVDKNDFVTITDITSIDDVNIIATDAASKPDGYYNAGMIEDENGIFRFISKHVGNQLTLIRPLDSLEIGTDKAKIYPGCDRSKETCKNTFDNILNNGSSWMLPITNPFTTTQLF